MYSLIYVEIYVCLSCRMKGRLYVFVISLVVDCMSLSCDLQENCAAATDIARRGTDLRTESWQRVS